ncbi:hypothetical protein F8388_012182 [Cannabis sativa]|uniref:Pentatricopeptide repeat-containing protein n=1 Tax=Cannabis sativa TaxID=3483 RepID=A0A7J6F656_CANSA|nr:hypothetical protein F8388_012182 [Cannabis sativa]KAF4397764.1 hypothetical protein G4B88_025256 [Cannabis sativa]
MVITKHGMISSTFKRTPFLTLDKTLSAVHDYISHPNSNTLSSALQHYIDSDNPYHGRKIHAHVIKTGYEPNTNISIKLLILHLKCGCLTYARQMFDEMPHRTLSAYNYIIGGYLRQGQVEESLSLVRRLVLSGENPDGYTFSMILKASTSASYVPYRSSLGKIVHAQIIKSDVGSDNVLYTALVASYVKSGKIGYARAIFELMLERNVVCSTSLITGYMNQGDFDEAKDIFSKTIDKDIVVFNAMIEGYSKLVEHASKSLDIYIQMQRLNFRPNISTFASVIGACSMLTAFEVAEQVQTCSHAGLVDKGLEIFRIMEAEYFLKPKMEHYACVVDLLGRAGRLSQAWEFVKAMPEKPNSDVWAALLSSSRLHGYVEMASIAANELFKLNANDRPGAYIALSNTLADAGKWDSVSEIRDKMKVRGVSKDTGCSWVAAEFSL